MLNVEVVPREELSAATPAQAAVITSTQRGRLNGRASIPAPVPPAGP